MHYVRFFTALLTLLTFTLTVSAQYPTLYGLQHVNPGTPLSSDYELVEVDAYAAVGNLLYEIPETQGLAEASSAFDPNQRRYVFWGTDADGDHRFYSANTDTPDWYDPLVAGDRPVELQYDLQAKQMYGLMSEIGSDSLLFAQVDLLSGQQTVIATIPAIRFVVQGTSTFDSNHHLYFFVGIEATTQATRLYTINAQTGEVVETSDRLSATRHIRALQYDLTSDQLLALYSVPDETVPNDPTTNSPFFNTYLAEVNPVSGDVAYLNQTPIFSGYRTGVILGSTSFDQLSRTFVAAYIDDTSNRRLLLVDAQTGNLLSNTIFPQMIYELKADNQVFADQTYSQVTSTKDIASLQFEMYPNPTQGQATLRLPSEIKDATVRVFDARGHLFQQTTLTPGRTEMDLSVAHLPAGIYMVQVVSNGQQPMTQRLIKR